METFRVVQPSQSLAFYVKHYWLLETTSVSGSTERIIPCGNIQMLFYRGNPISLSTTVGTKRFDSESILCGQFIGYSELNFSGKIQIIAVVFHSYAARAFFGMPVSELCDQKVSASEVGDPELLELEDRIMNERDDMNCIRLIEHFLLHHLAPLKDYNRNRMVEVFRLIDNCGGNIRIPELATSSCLSTKQFQRIFTEHVGINPKDFLRIVRFQYALRVMQLSPAISSTQLAYECGFYDQPHLINEFKLFSGYTPKEYLSVCAPYSDYFE